MWDYLLENAKLRLLFEYFNSSDLGMFKLLGLVVFSLFSIKYGLRILNNIGTFYFGYGKVNLKKHGSWAVVTGCTDGIGKAYAELLAKQGLNMVLISRTLAKLEEQAAYLANKYAIQTKVIAVDFTEPNDIYPKIGEQLEGLDIALLLNNVGMSSFCPEYFHLLGKLEGEDFLNRSINCNIMAVTKMTALVLPGMVARKKGGYIVNTSSSMGRMICPLFTLYSSTKAYIDYFSRGLNVEYKSHGITVQSLCPFYVATKMSGAPASFISPTPPQYAESAIKTLGSQSITNGFLIHNIQGFFIEDVLPQWVQKMSVYAFLSIQRKTQLDDLKRKKEDEAKTGAASKKD